VVECEDPPLVVLEDFLGLFGVKTVVKIGHPPGAKTGEKNREGEKQKDAVIKALVERGRLGAVVFTQMYFL